MTINDMVVLAQARAVYLSQLFSSHAALGDVEAMAVVEAELTQTQATLDALQTLS